MVVVRAASITGTLHCAGIVRRRKVCDGVINFVDRTDWDGPILDANLFPPKESPILSSKGHNRVDNNHCVALLINSREELITIELRSFTLHEKCVVHAKINVRSPSGYHPLVER